MISSFKWLVEFKVSLNAAHYFPKAMESSGFGKLFYRDSKGRFTKKQGGRRVVSFKDGGSLDLDRTYKYGFITNRPLTKTEALREMQEDGVFKKRILKNIGAYTKYNSFIEANPPDEGEFYGTKMLVNKRPRIR